MSYRAYLQIARVDHWFKQVFVIPGVVLALALAPGALAIVDWGRVALAILATSVVASSNYVLNELLDASRDRVHPTKKTRAAAAGQVRAPVALAEWIALAVIGVGLGYAVNGPTAAILVVLWVMGCVYNVPPVRSKDQPVIDVLSEAVNNAIRLAIGWTSTGVTDIPPLSIVMAYWMLGAFLMAVKRYAEYVGINDPAVAREYRASFAYYTPDRLLISIVAYSAAFGLFAGLFIMRYRLELALGIPWVAGFMAYYLKLGFQKDSPAQAPEKLYKQRGFAVYTAMVFVLLLGLFIVDVPWVYEALDPTVPPASAR